jgi:hypothetical protein
MHDDAVNLRLNHCVRQASGNYECFLDHDFLPSLHRTGHGHAVFDAAPARTPGWYMSVFVECD